MISAIAGCLTPRRQSEFTVRKTESRDCLVALTTSLYGRVGTLRFVLSADTIRLQVAGEVMPELGPVSPGAVKLI